MLPCIYGAEGASGARGYGVADVGTGTGADGYGIGAGVDKVCLEVGRYKVVVILQLVDMVQLVVHLCYLVVTTLTFLPVDSQLAA